MKRNKILAALIVFAVLISCMAILFACTPEAQEEDKTVRVRYDYNDGSVVVERVLNRNDVLSIIPPARTGYTFSGWTLDKDGTQKVDTEALEDGSTIYAQWTAEECFVYFVIESETVKKEKVPYGSKVTPPTTEEINAKLPEGYEFKGWQNFSEDDIITKKTIYYAEIAKIVIPDPEYTVTFTDGGDFNHESKGTVGTKINAPLKTEEPTKDGYTFVGWKTSEGVEFEDGMTIEKNETFYATWTINRPANPSLDGDDAITYGETAEVKATLANTRDGINYSITWYIGNTKIGEGASVEVENLVATKADEYHTVRCQVVAYDDTLTSDPSSEIFKIIVKKATLTATIADINVTYGENLPALKIDYSGFIGNDNVSVLNTDNLKAATQYTNKSNYGEYPVSLTGVSADNYEVVSTTAKIYVARKSISGTQKFTFDETYNGNAVAKQLDSNCFEGLLDGHTITFNAETNGGNVDIYGNDALTKTYKIVDGDGIDVSGNYIVNCDVEIEIIRAAITADIKGVTLTYNGEWQKADVKDVFTNANVANYVATYSTSEDGEYTSAMPAFKNAGTYTVYLSIDAGSNYCALERCPFTVEIQKASVTIKANEQTVVYGKELSIDNTKYTIDGETFGDDIIVSLACNYQAGYGVGEYNNSIDVVANENDNPNFDITTQSGTLKVTPAPLTITLNNDSVVYGNEYYPDAETLVKSYEGLYGTDDVNVAIITEYEAGNEVGEYEISCQIDNGNYTLVTVNTGKLNVTKRALTIELTLKDAKLVYGEETMPTFEWFVVPEQGSFYGDDDRIFDSTVVFEHGYVTYDQETKTHGNAGKYEVEGYHFTDANSKIAKNYDITLKEFSFSVATRQVYLTLNEKSVVYGEDITFDFAKDVTVENNNGYYGLLEEDNIANNVTFTTNYTKGNTTVGTDGNDLSWTVAVNNTNYDVRIDLAGHIVVTARDLTITYTKTNVPQNSGEFSFNISDNYANGLYDGDTITSGKFTLKSTENIGEYKFNDVLEEVALVVKCDGNDVTKYYNITFDITLKVVEIPISHELITIEENHYVYNGTPQTVADLYIDEEGVTVFVEYKNTTTGETGSSDTMPMLTNAGTYKITYTLTKEGKTPYTYTFEVTIHTYEFEIVVKDPHTPEDLDEPTFLVQFGDKLSIDENQRYYTFKNLNGNNNDVWANLGMSEEQLINALNVQIDTGYEVGVTGAGLHDVAVTWNEIPNCTVICDTKDQLDVGKQPVVVYGGNYTTVYGEKAVTYTTGFSTHLYVDGQTYDPNNLMFKNDYAPLAAQYITLEPIRYTVGATGTFATEATCTNGNYEVKVCEVTMTVTKRPITIKANDAEMTYGGNLPTFSYSIVSGNLVDGDPLDVTFTTINVTGVGTYDIIPTVASNDKYDVTVQNGTLTVNKATLTVTLSAQNTTITYGDDMPTYTIASYDGFVGDNESVLSGTLKLVCDYLNAKKADTFTVSASGLEATNYNIIYAAQDLVVTPAPLTVAAAAFDGTITYGSAVPSFPYSTTGLVNGDAANILNGKVKFDTTYYKGANVGTYTYNVKSVDTLDNYTVTVDTSTQTLDVVKANYTKADVDAALNAFTVSGTYAPNQTLASFDNQLVGTGFAWKDSNIVPTCKVAQSTGYEATYCADTTNYNVYEGAYIKIVLAKAETTLTFENGTKDANGNFVFSTDYTGNTINLAEVITGISANHQESTNFSYAVSAPSTMTSAVDGGIYTITCTLDATDNYNKGTLDVILKVKYILVNGTSYVLEELSTLSNGTITLTSYNGVTNVNAFVSGDVTIGSNVTFELLGDSSDTDDAETPTYGTGAASYVDNNATYIAHKLTINKGATMTVNGTIIIRGLMGVAGGILEGHTSGLHSQIINNGEMTLNNGATMAVRGYIKGNGTATFNGGSVYMPFVVRDFKGGTYTAYKAWNAAILVDSWTNRVAPFSEYEMINIQCTAIYNSGTKLQGYADLYASSKHNQTTIDMISASGVIRLSSSASLTHVFNKATGRSTLTLKGNITIGSLSLEVAGTTVNMSSTFFPIPWTYDINVGDGTTATTLNISNDYKILPGSTITIKENATVSASSGNVIVYSDWTDDNSIQKYPTTYGTAGKLVLDGGTLNAYTFGGIIYATSNGGTVKASNAVSVTAYEHNNSDRYKVTESARFENGTTLQKNITYTYNGSSWS